MFVWAIAKRGRGVFLFLHPNQCNNINNNIYRLLAKLHNSCFEISCGSLHNDSVPDLYDASFPEVHKINRHFKRVVEYKIMPKNHTNTHISSDQ